MNLMVKVWIIIGFVVISVLFFIISVFLLVNLSLVYDDVEEVNKVVMLIVVGSNMLKVIFFNMGWLIFEVYIFEDIFLVEIS